MVPAMSAHVPLAAIDRPGRVDPATVGGLWSLMRRHRWTVAIGVLVMVVLVGLFTFLVPPRWEAVAAVRLEETKVDLPDLVTRVGQDREVSTEQAALESRRLAEATIDSLQLRAVTTPVRVPRNSLFSAIAVAQKDDSAEFTFTLKPDKSYSVHNEDTDKDVGVVKPGGSIALPGVTVTLAPAVTEDQFTLEVTSRDAAVDKFSKALKVDRPDRDANVLTLTYRGTDKTLVRDIPNVLAGLFIADRDSQHKVEAKSTAKVLAQQLDSVQRQLAASENELEAFRTQNGVVSLPDEATSDVNHLAELQADRNTVGAERDALGSLMADVTAQAARQRPDQPSPYRRLIAFPTLLKNNAASELLASLATVEDERTALLQRRTAKDPDVLVLTARIESIDQQLKSIGQTYLQGLNNQVSADDSVLRTSTAKMRAIPAKEIQFARLSRQPKVLEDIYTTLQTRLKEAQVSAAVVDPSVYVMDPAVTPHKPVMPRPALYMAASVVLGLMLGIGLALAGEARDHTIHTRADVLAATGAPVLGLIPRINLGDEFMSRLRLAEDLGPPGTGGRRRLTGKRRSSFTGPHLQRQRVRQRAGDRSVGSQRGGRGVQHPADEPGVHSPGGRAQDHRVHEPSVRRWQDDERDESRGDPRPAWAFGVARRCRHAAWRDQPGVRVEPGAWALRHSAGHHLSGGGAAAGGSGPGGIAPLSHDWCATAQSGVADRLAGDADAHGASQAALRHDHPRFSAHQRRDRRGVDRVPRRRCGGRRPVGSDGGAGVDVRDGTVTPRPGASTGRGAQRHRLPSGCGIRWSLPVPGPSGPVLHGGGLRGLR